MLKNLITAFLVVIKLIPESWCSEDWATIREYLLAKGLVPTGIPLHRGDLCMQHYRCFTKLFRERSCSVCAMSMSRSWCLASSLPNLAQHYNIDKELGSTDWVCEECVLCTTDIERFQTTLKDQTHSCDPNLAVRAELINQALCEIVE